MGCEAICACGRWDKIRFIVFIMAALIFCKRGREGQKQRYYRKPLPGDFLIELIFIKQFTFALALLHLLDW